MSISKQNLKVVDLTDLQFDTLEFYLSDTHRHADLYIKGGNVGESVNLEILNSNDSKGAHYATWTQIANGQQQSLIFDPQRQIRLVDNCITQTCVNEIELKFVYHEREYLVTLNIDVTQ